MKGQSSLLIRLGGGLVAGAGIAAVDNFASGGEVSPVVIVAMLLLAAGTAGMIWGSRAFIVAAAIWAFLPSAHLAKHLLGLPDTIHPNTYASILEVAIFSFFVTACGFGFGLMCRCTLRRAC